MLHRSRKIAQREMAVNVGNGTNSGSLSQNGSTDNRLLILFRDNDTRDFCGLGHYTYRNKHIGEE